ncbi:MAG TPA: hypothetical protein VLY84_00080 [Dysgonamonadaceae bacterium]|nr:hypothetical protein [Dysgonamonadaceae bacterium]
MAYVDWKDIIYAADKGLAIIRLVHPHVDDALTSRDRKFKARDEKTASASLRLKDGHYHVTDFGGDQKERNSIGVYMHETGKEFHEAVKYLAEFFKVEGSQSSWTEIKPVYESRALTPDDVPGSYIIEEKEFTSSELALIGPAVTAQHCGDFKMISVKSFSRIKENEVTTWSSTDAYPIFAFEYDGWAKIYQPLSYNKAFRFSYLGEKPKRHLYGLDILKKQFEKNKERLMDEDFEDDNEDSSKKKKKDPRVDRVFIVSGGSDGMNLRSFGYFPVWLNSETQELDFEEYKELLIYAQEIIYVPDLDATGLKQALKIALKYLDVKIMMLPNYLKQRKDNRGNPCKDVKDFVVSYYKKSEARSFNNRLTKLIENALPAMFWSEYWTAKGKKFNFRHTQFYNFLKMNGFGRIKDEYTKDGFRFVHVEGNIVTEVHPVEIEAFVHQFLKTRELPIELRDLIYSKNLSENALKKLDSLDIEFSSSSSTAQYLFFENAVLKITADAIEQKKRGDVDRYIWSNKMLNHVIHAEQEPFEIKKDVHGNDDIIIKETDNWFLNYLINGSRVHWRKELEDGLANKPDAEVKKYLEDNKFNIAGPILEDDEVQEQKLHLINKLYALGYMCHTYRSPDKPWALYAMDNKIADISESHGGSGKSVFLKGIQQILKQNHYINGRDSRKTQDDFIYHGVDSETDYIMVDDCHANTDFGFFYNAISGDLDVNNKNGLRFIIPADKVGKIGFASNYPPNDLGPSLARRLLFIVFGDYYHFNADGEYNENRAVSDDFGGKTLFKDFDERQWNKFYYLCACAIKFYLSSPEKINSPMGNVKMRNLLSEMGTPFKDWADVFFAQKDALGKPLYLDVLFIKDFAFDNLKEKTGYKYTSHSFKKKIRAFAEYNEWSFNPKDKDLSFDSNGRIMKNIDGKTCEMFFIDTKIASHVEAITASSDGIVDSLDSDLPF